MARQGKGGGGKAGRGGRAGGGAGGGGGASAGAIRAGAAFVELFAKDNMLSRGLKAASDKVRAWAGSVAKLGVAAMAGGAAILAPITAALKGVLDRGAELNRLSQVYGDTVENISALMYAADRSGAGAERLKNAMENLPERINDAATGSAEIAKAFASIGVNAAELKDKSFTEQLMAIADGMASVSNSTERAALASKLFSDVGLEGMIPLLGKGSGQLRAWLKEAKEVGAVMSSEDAKRSAEVGGLILKVWTALKSTFEAVGIAMEKVILVGAKYVDPIVRNLVLLREWIKNNQLLVGTIAAIGGALVIGGAALVAFSIVLGGLAQLFLTIGAAVSLLLSPLGLVIAAVTTATAVLATMAALGVSVWLKFSEGGKQTAKDFKDAWTAMAESVRSGNVEGAVNIVSATINLAWVRLTEGIKSAWRSMLFILRTTFIAVFQSIESHFVAFRNVIAGGITAIGEKLGMLPAGSTEQSKQQSRDELKAIRDAAENDTRILLAQQLQSELDSQRRLEEARKRFNEAIGNARSLSRMRWTLPEIQQQNARTASLPIGTVSRGAFQFGNAGQFFGGSTSYQQMTLKKMDITNDRLNEILSAFTSIPIARL